MSKPIKVNGVEYTRVKLEGTLVILEGGDRKLVTTMEELNTQYGLTAAMSVASTLIRREFRKGVANETTAR